MPVEAFLLVLCSALVHAAWNALIKLEADRLALIRIMCATQVVLSLALIPFVAVPAAPSWPYLGASALLGIVYVQVLNRAYQAGDLSFVYPLARGVAPLLVALASVVLVGEQLARGAQLAVLLIGLGITSLALTRSGANLRDPRAVLFALATGCVTATSTIVDGLGARLAGSPHSYMVWLSLVTSSLIVASLHRRKRADRPPLARRTLVSGVASGVLSYAAAWIVIWAFTVAPIALVSALRETGIVFAVVIGVAFLRERLNLARLASILVTLLGAALLKLSR